MASEGRERTVLCVMVAAAIGLGVTIHAQGAGQPGRGGQPPAAPPTARSSAPIDLTGYWVSLVTNEWRWRMLTPPKGEYDVLPLNAEARRVADTWDPAKDEAAGEQCRSYGAALIMQVPGRLRVTWENDNTLRVDTDAGQQTRRFQFGRLEPPTGEPGWQGDAVAQWQPAQGQAREARVQPAPARMGGLKVVTRRMRPGYLRKNGVPYSSDAVVTEYFAPFTDARGTAYFSVTVIVEDPRYLTEPYIRSMQFKKEADGSKWSPEPCSAR